MRKEILKIQDLFFLIFYVKQINNLGNKGGFIVAYEIAAINVTLKDENNDFTNFVYEGAIDVDNHEFHIFSYNDEDYRVINVMEKIIIEERTFLVRIEDPELINKIKEFFIGNNFL
jgi:predicted glutamine amidotransferase